MIIVKHRVNNSKDLIKLNKRFGVEIDLRIYITTNLKRSIITTN